MGYSKMTSGQIFWGVISFSFAIAFFFAKTWMSSLSKNLAQMDDRINKKLDSIVCVERNDAMKQNCQDLFKHKHAPVRPDSTGGEVIIPR